MDGLPQNEADGAFLPFRPRARLLQLLGDQLRGSHRLAVFELVKKAYDADATKVTVTLNNIDQPDATIVVEDDGEGTTLNMIRDIWLVPGHDHREVQRRLVVRLNLGLQCPHDRSDTGGQTQLSKMRNRVRRTRKVSRP